MKKKLELGYGNSDFEIRRYRYFKGINQPFTILYLSDLHFNRYSQSMLDKLLDMLHNETPGLILFGGDYLDCNAGYNYLYRLFCTAKSIAPTFAILGNHDRIWNTKSTMKSINASGIILLDNKEGHLTVNDLSININHPRAIKSSIVVTDETLKITCCHRPRNPSKFIYSSDLVFSGHLHGCQIVLWKHKKGMYPGRLFYRYNLEKYELDDMLYLVSKGLGDTLPIRYNCTRDVVLVHVY
ncbi:MAG: metallophosphoesterase [Bacteroidota bacterium]